MYFRGVLMWAVQCSCLLCIAFCMCVIHTDHPPSYTREARPSNTDHGNKWNESAAPAGLDSLTRPVMADHVFPTIT